MIHRIFVLGGTHGGAEEKSKCGQIARQQRASLHVLDSSVA